MLYHSRTYNKMYICRSFRYSLVRFLTSRHLENHIRLDTCRFSPIRPFHLATCTPVLYMGKGVSGGLVYSTSTNHQLSSWTKLSHLLLKKVRPQTVNQDKRIATFSSLNIRRCGIELNLKKSRGAVRAGPKF